MTDPRILKTRAKDRLEYAISHGRIVRPTECSECGGGGRIFAHHPDLTKALEPVWLCISCYRKVNLPAKRAKKLELVSKCPPYAVMRADYLRRMTVEEMAAKYGVCRANAHATLVRRAKAHGEWPALRFQREKIQPTAIACLVRDFIRTTYNEQPMVVVPVKAAAAWAPHTVVRETRKGWVWRREVFPSDPVRYHNPDCTHTFRSETFEILVTEAEDWGYTPCVWCRETLAIRQFCDDTGLYLGTITKLVTGRRQHIPRKLAVRLLDVIGETVPEWMAA